MFNNDMQLFDFMRHNIIQKLACKVTYIDNNNGGLIMFFENPRINARSQEKKINTRKRNTNIVQCSQ